MTTKNFQPFENSFNPQNGGHFMSEIFFVSRFDCIPLAFMIVDVLRVGLKKRVLFLEQNFKISSIYTGPSKKICRLG